MRAWSAQPKGSRDPGTLAFRGRAQTRRLRAQGVGGQLCWEVGQEEREADPGSVSGVVTVTKAPSVVRRGQKPEGEG